MEAGKMYELWLTDSYFDEDTRKELQEIAGDEAEIEERFGKELEFGTGGLRGIIGAGTNRMNKYVVGKATQGLADYIKGQGAQDKGVAIAYDSRRKSGEFAKEAALCLAANGIRAYLFPSLRPTPMLSFALRYLGCTAGIVVTASHNPAEYNGYKVYWEDGAQITAPRDKEIIEQVRRVRDFKQVKTMGEEEARQQGLYQMIGSQVDDAYMEELKKLVIHPEILKEEAGDLKIVYTPLHGTGNLPVRRILKELGFTNVYVVKEQELPDGEFPTVPYPNPEDKRAFELALKLARQVDADLVLATDPDADRLGIYARDSVSGEYKSFSGNMSGMILLEYILSQKKEMGTLPKDGAVVTTIVSGKMAREIARAYGVDLIETLTGFKYIGEQIKFFEENRNHTYVFGYEESYGCLVGTHARDKDAVVAVMALCEAAAYYKHQGMTLCDQMERLFETYGYFKEGLCTVTKKGLEGAKEIEAALEAVRKEVPESIGGLKVEEFRDYREGVVLDYREGAVSDCREDGVSDYSEDAVLNYRQDGQAGERAGRRACVRRSTGLPRSNVLYFELEGGAWCCIRPSGTEPKIKFYMGVKGSGDEDADRKLESLTEALTHLTNSLDG